MITTGIYKISIKLREDDYTIVVEVINSEVINLSINDKRGIKVFGTNAALVFNCLLITREERLAVFETVNKYFEEMENSDDNTFISEHE